MGLSEREKAFEAKFQHDEELKFRINARRAKLFGLWIAGEIGLTGGEADAYARSIVEVDLEEPGADDILRKVRADLSAHRVEISEHMLATKLDETLATATEQVMNETGKG